jgi:hypothetical protein
MKMGLRVARYSRLSSGQLRTKLPAATQAASLLFQRKLICKTLAQLLLQSIQGVIKFPLEVQERQGIAHKSSKVLSCQGKTIETHLSPVPTQ